MKLLILFILSLFIYGCQGFSIPGITAVAPITNVGDDADTITKTTVNNGPDYFWMAMCIIGWMAPSPRRIWSGVMDVMRGFGDFILKILGRR